MLLATLLLPLAFAPPGDADQLAATQAIFDEACTICHDSTSDLNLEDASALVDLASTTGMPLINPSNPNESYLYLKMVAAEGIEGESMPLGDDPLPADQLATVQAWIASIPAAEEPAEAPPEPSAEPVASPQAIFDDSCTGCHDSSSDLNLEEVESLIGLASTTGMALVNPGDPTQSYIYLKMTGAEGIEGESMPMGDDPLPAEQLAAVEAWIAALPTETPENTDPDEVKPPPIVPKRKPKQPFFGSHQINLQTTTTLGKKTISFRIHHRLGLVGWGTRSYIGLAGPAVMSMGAEYGIVDGLDVMARWTNSNLDWELGLKYVPVRQETGKPLSFGMYASFEALTAFPTNAANRFTGNFQAMLSRLWFERWSTQLTVNYSLLTNHSTAVNFDIADDGVDGAVPVTDNRGTLNVGLASTIWLGKKKKHGIDLEYQLPIPSDVFYYNGGNVNPDAPNIGSWGLGWSARTGLHQFQVFVTNTKNIHTNLVAPGGDTQNPFSPFGDFFFGFNITRKWKL